MSPERFRTVGRALAWSSPALVAAAILATISFGLAGVGDGDQLLPALLTLVYAAVAAGVAGAVLSVHAARRLHGPRRAKAIRAAALAAVVPALFVLVWVAWNATFEWGP